MRIVFLGASDLGWECCRALLDMGQRIVGILSVPPEFNISWSPTPVRNVRFRGFEDLAERHDVPLAYVTGGLSGAEHRERIQALQPDLLVAIGWYHMVPRSWRGLAPLGAVGLHGSLLPRYRGGAPLVWAMIHGETRAGVTLFHLGDGVDDGDIIGQAEFPIDFGDDIADVVRKSTEVSVGLVRRYIPMLATGTAPRRPQDHSQATVMPQRRPEDGLIDWRSKSAWQAHNWVRAQTRPYPGAFTYLSEEKLTVWKVCLSPAAPREVLPGTVTVKPPDTVGVVCADGRVLRLEEVELGDGTVLSGAELVAVRPIGEGTVLGGAHKL